MEIDNHKNVEFVPPSVRGKTGRPKKKVEGYDMDMSVEEYLIVICVLVAVLIYNKMKNSHPSKHETKQHDDKNRDDKENS